MGESLQGMLTRRRFIHLSVAAGAAGLLGCRERGPGAEGGAPGEGEPEPAFFVKDPARLIRHPTNLETRLQDLRGFIPPNDLFFVRNHSPTPRIDPGSFRLRVGGAAVTRPLELSLADLEAMPSRSVVAFLECAGNWRGLSEELTGRPASGGQWTTGAVGNAEWTGVPLREILERAGLRDDAVDVNLHGMDAAAFNRPMSVRKALHEDTILAWAMNGEPLPPDHGFPLRAVVPGWVGSNSIKWLGRIEVSPEPMVVGTNTTSYVLVGESWPARGEALGEVVYETTIKSALALPRPAALTADLHRIRGYAHGAHPVARVEWSADGGRSWRDARLLEPALPWAWRRFELEWDATPGQHVLMTRATDRAGNTQPLPPLPHNELGYLLNGVLRHAVSVA